MSNFLPLGIRNILEKTDWSENEILVYSILLEKGAMDLTSIAQETGLATSTVQAPVKSLLTKKMLSRSLVNSKPVYSASDVNKLKKWIKGIMKQFEGYDNTISKFIEQYDFNPLLVTAKVRFYEGYKGVKQSYRQMLEECTDKDVIKSFFSSVEEVGVELHDFFLKEYLPKRVEQGIWSKNIALKSKTSLDYKNNKQKYLSEVKIFAKNEFPQINTEINIYKDFIHCMSFTDKNAFAIIVQDSNMSLMLESIFKILWNSKEKLMYMTDSDKLQKTTESRKDLYTDNLKEKWKNTKPLFFKKNNETVLTILKHEVISDFEIPYMKKLGEIVTRNGGDILNIGYGMGIVDKEIEAFREERNIKDHYIIELNQHLAKQASKEKYPWKVIEGDWDEVVDGFRGEQFDGIVYDGYPLTLEEVHRDGIDFIERIVQRNLLKKNGILTFYADIPEKKFGEKFIKYLKNLGFECIGSELVPIKLPKREVQYWDQHHFLAPILKYTA